MINSIVKDPLFAARSAYHSSQVPAPASTPVPVSVPVSSSASAPVQIILVVLDRLQSINEFNKDHVGLFRESSSGLSDRIDDLKQAVLQQPVGDLANDCLTDLSPHDLCNIIKKLVNGLDGVADLAEAKDPLFYFLYRVAANADVTKMDPINLIKTFPKIKEFGDELHNLLLDLITSQEKKDVFTQEYSQTLVVQMAQLEMLNEVQPGSCCIIT
tara:strand:+ start:126 stop:767 length:642 start_codon:yes stop_codon:yes gene_type:complete